MLLRDAHSLYVTQGDPEYFSWDRVVARHKEAEGNPTYDEDWFGGEGGREGDRVGLKSEGSDD